VPEQRFLPCCAVELGSASAHPEKHQPQPTSEAEKAIHKENCKARE
jgi:hypothetical protein